MNPAIESFLKVQLPSAVRLMSSYLKYNKNISLTSFQQLQIKLKPNNPSPDLILDLNTFGFLLSQFPGLWAELFLNERIHCRYTDIQLGNHIYAFNQELNIIMGKNTNHQIFFKIAEEEIQQYIYDITKRLVEVFSHCKRRLRQKVASLNIFTSKEIYTNKYIIFKLLKQFSTECINDVKTYILPLFEKVEYTLFKRFVRWVIKKHEVINIKLDKPIENWVNYKDAMSKKEFQEAWVNVIHKIRQSGEEISYSAAQRSDGKTGILVVKQTGSDDEIKNSKILIFSDDYDSVAIMNCALMTMRWKSKISSTELRKIEVPKEHQIEHLLENQEEISQELTQPKELTLGYEAGVENVGEALGSCIANFKEYDSIQSFLEDFSKEVLVTGGLGIISERIPIVGKLLVIGGFSQQMFKIIFSQYKTFRHKVADFAKVAAEVSLTIVGGLIGLSVGEFLIPIEIIGPIVGGGVGGYFTTKWINKADDILENHRLSHIYKGLKLQMHHNGWFKHSDQLLNLFQMKASYFDSTVPNLHSNDDKSLWMTALCFFVLSYYECKKDQQEQVRKIKAGTLGKQEKEGKHEKEQNVEKNHQQEKKNPSKLKDEQLKEVSKQIVNDQINQTESASQNLRYEEPADRQDIPLQSPKFKKGHHRENQGEQKASKRCRSNNMICPDLQKIIYYLEHRNFKIIDHMQSLSELLIKVLAL